MAPILLRLAGRDALMDDTEFEPPDVEFGQAADGLSSERVAVIRADGNGQAELLKQAGEDGKDARLLYRGKAVAAEQEA